MTDRPRNIVTVEPLPVYDTAAEQISHLDADIREAAARIKKTLEDNAAKYTVTGWTIDPDIELAIIKRNVIGRMRLTRDA